MCPISFNVYGMKLNEVHFSLGTVVTHFYCHSINFKSHFNNVLPCDQGKLLSDLLMSRVILFHFAWLCSLLQWDWKVPIINVIEIL